MKRCLQYTIDLTLCFLRTGAAAAEVCRATLAAGPHLAAGAPSGQGEACVLTAPALGGTCTSCNNFSKSRKVGLHCDQRYFCSS